VQVNDRPAWRTVSGGSIQYVNKVIEALPHVHLGTAVESVERRGDHVHVYAKGESIKFDRVVFATHAPITRKILRMDNSLEKEILGSFHTEPNRAVLHQDPKSMPKQKRCWSAWNIWACGNEGPGKINLTYHLNRLQHLNSTQEYFLTLNPSRKAHHVHREFDYAHPRFDQSAIKAQSRLEEIQGRGGVYFAGAWTRHGFHEDGLLSAVKVAQAMGAETPWKTA
jgi:predicted NAD/FAD-binding protein